MRYYFPESPKFRFFLQKPECQKLTEPAPVDTARAAPKNKDDLRREQNVKQAAAKQPPQANARAHRVLDQIEAVHKWWTTTPAYMQPAAPKTAVAAAVAGPKTKPFDPFDLQDVPDTEQGKGYKLDPALMRQWFSNPAYAVQSQEQKDCLPGAPFYPATLVDSTTLKLTELMKTVERLQLAHDMIKSPEFLGSQRVRNALYKICSKLPAGTVDVDPMSEFGGDLQKMHRRYAFASITVGKRFPQGMDDIRVQALDKSGGFVDDVELALGEFKLYAAIHDAHVFNNGRTTRRVNIKEIAIYIMAPYGFDDFEQGVPYLGHFNKKHFALVTDGDWVNAPVYSGKDQHAKNALLRPVSISLYMQWRQKHNKGGDMLLFSERRPSFPNMDVVVPLSNRMVFGIYYQTVDGAFKRALETEIRELNLGNDIEVILKGIKHEDEFKAAWSEIAARAKDASSEVLLGMVFTHASKPTGEDSGFEFYPSPGNDATLKHAELTLLEKLPWAADGKLDLRGCNTGNTGTKRNWSPASVMAAAQGVMTVGQMGYSYFSSNREKYERLETTSEKAYLWAYRRKKNSLTGDDLQIPAKVEK